MSFFEDQIREVAARRADGDAWAAARALGDLLEGLATDARCRAAEIDPATRLALTPTAAWAELVLKLPGEGLYVRLELGKEPT